MAEFSPEVNRELSALSQAIESRRAHIEAERGVSDEREQVRQALREELTGNVSAAAPTPHTTPTGHYLDTLSDEEAERVQYYLAQVPHKGVRKTVEALRRETPFIEDAFHDALVDRFWEELTRHGTT